MVFYTKDALKAQIDIYGWNVGDFSYGGPLVFNWGNDGGLTIGKYCSFGAGVRIFLGGNHRPDWVTTYPFNKINPSVSHIEGHPATRGDVVIGNDVWLGANCLLLSGVTIGDGACIAADAVITRDVPPYCIVGGNPGKVIKQRFHPDQIEKLLAIRWWDWEPAELEPYLPLLLTTDIDGFINASLEREALRSIPPPRDSGTPSH